MTSWLIEHRGKGAYLGLAPNPRSGNDQPLFRADDPRKPAMIFPTSLAAQCELARIAKGPDGFLIVPLRR